MFLSSSHIARSIATLARRVRHFAPARNGNVAILFAVSSVVVVLGVGAGIDLARAYSGRQKISEVSTLTCQFSGRPSVLATNTGGATGFSSYLASVNTYAANSLTQAHWIGVAPVATNGTYFTAIAPTGSATTPTNPVTEIQAAVPTAFLGIVGVGSIKVHARIACQNAATAPAVVTAPLVLQEGFETACTGYCFTTPNGTTGTSSKPTSTTPSAPSYTGPSGAQWYVLGYCLEVDAAGVISSSDPEGTHSAELDCDNGSGTAGNSSISSKVTLGVGTYELRYDYRERIPNALYTPDYVCGSQINPDVNWVTNNTNEINVYLDQATSNTIPTHTTLDGTQQLGGANLIDTCVNSANWIERSVVITVTTAGSYWLSFAADGSNDSYGGQIDNIRLCNGLCAGAPQDDFPSSQLSSAPVYADVFSLSNAFTWNVFTKVTSVFISPMCKTLYFLCTTLPSTVTDHVMLDPGFYDLSYQYVSLATVSAPPNSQCNQTPGATDVGPFTSKTIIATNSVTGYAYSTKADVDFLGIFLSFPNQAFSPSIGAAITTTNPLVDSCLYSANVVTRSIAFEITKPGYYTLTDLAGGTATTPYQGGAIANVAITAIGSPYTMATSGYCPAVPVPGPQLGATITYPGYSFVVTNPFTRGASANTCMHT